MNKECEIDFHYWEKVLDMPVLDTAQTISTEQYLINEPEDLCRRLERVDELFEEIQLAASQMESIDDALWNFDTIDKLQNIGILLDIADYMENLRQECDELRLRGQGAKNSTKNLLSIYGLLPREQGRSSENLLNITKQPPPTCPKIDRLVESTYFIRSRIQDFEDSLDELSTDDDSDMVIRILQQNLYSTCVEIQNLIENARWIVNNFYNLKKWHNDWGKKLTKIL